MGRAATRHLIDMVEVEHMNVNARENGVVAAAGLRHMAERLVDRPGYSDRIVHARHGVVGLASVIEAANPPLPPHHLAALVDLLGRGVNDLLAEMD